MSLPGSGHLGPVLIAKRISAAGRRGSSRPLVVETEAGTRIVKLRGAAQGPAPLVAEIIVAALADAIGLAVPPRSLVELPAGIETAEWDDELADLLDASVGVNLGFDFLAGAREFAIGDVGRVPPETRAAILWLDRLVCNPDRTASNPNLLWWADQLWLIDHGAALGFQYAWSRVSEETPREPALMPDAHLFEGVVSSDELQAADAALADRLTRDVLDTAVAGVPDTFLAPLAEADAQPVGRRRAAYASFLWKRLKPPRPFLETRASPLARPQRKRPAWLIGR
jgi:hypothetical protein